MTIEFSQQEKEILVTKMQKYMLKELDVELGQFDGEFLLDFISKEMGNYFYNRGLYDAKLVLDSKIEDISDAMLDIEKPTTLR
jgi:uncharacterized protein (DUF2164 family)